jgi:hypothetical protein
VTLLFGFLEVCRDSLVIPRSVAATALAFLVFVEARPEKAVIASAMRGNGTARRSANQDDPFRRFRGYIYRAITIVDETDFHIVIRDCVFLSYLFPE